MLPNQQADFDPWDEPPTAAPAKRRRPRRYVENDEYLRFVRRIITAGRKRIEASDPESLAEWVRLSDELNDAIGAAVRAQQAAGFSWADIAGPLGITRQAAFKRWSK